MHDAASYRTLAVLGTGALGSHLGALFRRAGMSVVHGARSPDDRGRAAHDVEVVTFREAVRAADIALLAVPWSAALEVVAACGSWRDKLLIDATNPVRPDWSPEVLGPHTSAAEEIARAVPEATVVKAFNTVFADVMTPEGLDFGAVRPALFVCSDDASARRVVAELGTAMGFEPVEAGALLCARYFEAMAHLNIHLAVSMGGGTDVAFAYLRRPGS